MADEWKVVPATMEHAEALAPNMRKSDAEEVAASGGYTPEEALRASLSASREAYAMYLKGELALIFGVVGEVGQPGAIWALGSDAVSRYPKSFLRASLTCFELLKERYPVLINAVYAKNKASLRWVVRLGFKIFRPRPFGKRGELFVPIVWEAASV